jgi:hypothetical protein
MPIDAPNRSGPAFQSPSPELMLQTNVGYAPAPSRCVAYAALCWWRLSAAFRGTSNERGPIPPKNGRPLFFLKGGFHHLDPAGPS